MVVGSSHNREVAVRRRITSIFNKREDDFASLKEYNDYLEEVEDMTNDFIEGVDIAAIEEKIIMYEKENAEQIMNSRARKAEELAAALAAIKGQLTQTDNDMVQSNSAGVGGGVQGQYAPTIAGGQPRPTGLAPQPLPYGSWHDGVGDGGEETMKLRAERSAGAGGWSTDLSRKRALEEAYGSLWI